MQSLNMSPYEKIYTVNMRERRAVYCVRTNSRSSHGSFSFPLPGNGLPYPLPSLTHPPITTPTRAPILPTSTRMSHPHIPPHSPTIPILNPSMYTPYTPPPPPLPPPTPTQAMPATNKNTPLENPNSILPLCSRSHVLDIRVGTKSKLEKLPRRRTKPVSREGR